MNSNDLNVPAVERRADVPSTGTGPWIWVVGVIATSVIAVVAELIVAGQPGTPAEHAVTMARINSYLDPARQGFLGAALWQLGKQVDGRMSQLLTMTARTHALQGELAGQQKILDQLPVVPAVVVPMPGANGVYQHQRADDASKKTGE